MSRAPSTMKSPFSTHSPPSASKRTSMSLRLIAAPKANILDEPAINRFTQIFSEAGESRDLKAVLIEGEGAHFSFGASVPEHLPDAVGRMLPRFHQMFRTMLESEVFYAAVVRGQCLGGGLELASFCHRVFASPDAKLGQPEIVLVRYFGDDIADNHRDFVALLEYIDAKAPDIR